MVQLGCRNLVQSFSAFWDDQFAGDCPTIFPGMQVDASDWDCWVELQTPVIREVQRSQVGLQMVRFFVDVHCFVRRDTDLKKVHTVVDAVREVLSRSVWMVRDGTLSGQPVIGAARMGETEVRDLSRIEQRVLGGDLTHMLVSSRGLAQLTGEGE